MDAAVLKKLNSFFSQYKLRKCKKNEILILSGEDPKGIYYIKDGYVKMYGISKKGDELILNIFKPISFFPMNWAINNTPNIYYYEAMTPLTIWKAPKDKTLTFIKKNPEILFDLLSRVYTGVDGIISRTTYLMTGSAYARLVAEIIIYTRRLDRILDTIHDTRRLKITEKQLATSSGMTRETVSREMKRVKDKRLVSFTRNELTIFDTNRLEEELENY